MNLTSVKEAVNSGRIFGAVFTKKDGSTRKMTCRVGVRKDVKGKGLTFNPVEKNLLGVYEMPQGQYRFINVDTIQQLTVDGRVYA